MDVDIQTDRCGELIRFSLNRSVYPDEVVLKTAYWFTDRFFLYFDPLPENRLLVELRPKQSNSSVELQEVSGEFCNSLLDYRLRQIVLKETGSLREALITKAFSEGRTPPGLSHAQSDESAVE